jgi:carbonic anhydrase
MIHNQSLSRRQFVQLAGAAAGFSLAGNSLRAQEDKVRTPTPAEALKLLMDGNERFVAGKDTAAQKQRSPERRVAVAEGQKPFAIIMACADSRVVPELLFDQGLGDLFVIRVAGNVVHGAGPVVKGSIEYAVAVLGSPLVMVLGHSKCGAIKAALKVLDDGKSPPGAIGELVNDIKPAVEAVKGKGGDRLENAIRANVAEGVKTLKGLDPIVGPATKDGKVKVVGATYDLRSGKVELID